jgi:hypothetical protein
LLLLFVELLLVFVELLLVFVVLLLLFLLDVLVFFLTLVSDALNELDVVAVTSLVTSLRIVNLLLHLSFKTSKRTWLK